MTDLPFAQLLDTIRFTEGAYYKLTLIVGPAGSGKTRLLSQVATQFSLPVTNLSLLLSQRLLSQTRRQRALKAEEVATDLIDEHLQSGLCLDDTELLFDSSLRLNPLTFLQDISRNHLIVASWNGALVGGELRFGYAGHGHAGHPGRCRPRAAVAQGHQRARREARSRQPAACQGIPFWGQNLFTEPETEKLSALLTKAKEFLESLQAYNTPGKLKNFKYDATDIRAYQATFTRLTACNSSKEACARLVSPPNRASRASAAGFPASVESSSALLTCSQDSIGPSRSPPTEANSNTV